MVLKLNGGWGGRTQRLEILASSDGTTFTTVVPAADYVFDPSTNNNTVEIQFPAIQGRYIRVQATSNTGAPGAQIAEFEVYGNGPTATATNTPGGSTATATAGSTTTPGGPTATATAGAPPPPPPASTPELGSGELLGLGLISGLGVVASLRRKRSRRGHPGDNSTT